jgi:hypothetical protein
MISSLVRLSEELQSWANGIRPARSVYAVTPDGSNNNALTTIVLCYLRPNRTRQPQDKPGIQPTALATTFGALLLVRFEAGM